MRRLNRDSRERATGCDEEVVAGVEEGYGQEQQDIGDRKAGRATGGGDGREEGCDILVLL